MNDELMLDEIKNRQIEILDYFDDFCKRNRIRYYLEAGTLLGAVRHKGYIPWDDDLDVIVRRKDYRRLLRLLEKEQERFKVISMYNRNDYYYLFAKIVDSETILIERGLPPIKDLGVYIDIFPLDGVPKSFIMRKIYYDIFSALRTILVFTIEKNNNTSIYARILDKIAFIVGREKALFFANKFCEINSHLFKKQVFNVVGFLNNQRYKSTDSKAFRRRIKLDFENKKYYGPLGFDEYLTSKYGKYMEYPPIEKRISGHNYDAYLKK